MSELQKEIGEVFMAFGKTILEQGLPKGPLIIQGEPGREHGFFIAVWPNTGDRAEHVITLKK